MNGPGREAKREGTHDMIRVAAAALVACLCAFPGHLRSQERAGAFREFVMGDDELAGFHAAVRAVRFTSARAAGPFERRGADFTFTAEGGGKKILFRSRKFASLCDRVNNAQQFGEFVARATLFGVEAPGGDLEGHVLLSSVCYDARCTDEDYVLVPAD